MRNDIFTAVRDGGATLNSRAVAASANHQLRSSLLATQAQSDDERPSAARRVQPTARRTSWRRTGICTMICWLSSTKAEARITTARGRRRCLVCRCFTPCKRRAGILPAAIEQGVSRWPFGKIYPRTLAFWPHALASCAMARSRSSFCCAYSSISSSVTGSALRSA